MKTQSRILSSLAALLLGAPLTLPAANQTWNGGGTPDGNWANSANWNSILPNAGDSLDFSGAVNPLATNNFTAGTAFNGITFDASATVPFTLYGNGVLLSGAVLGNTNGVISTSASAQTVNLNLTNDWGFYIFNSSGGGTLALNGALANNAGGLAYFGANVTSTSFTTDGTGLISGLGASGMMMTGGMPYGPAAINGGTVGDYVYPAANKYIAAALIASNVTNNVQLNPTANTTYPVATGSALNSVANTSGSFTATLSITNTLKMGPVGAFYVADGLSSAGGAPNATKNLITLAGAGSFLTAGGTTVGTPGTLIFDVNGTGTGNSMGVNPTSITNNGAGGTVTVIKTGSGSMFFQSVNGYSGGTYIDQGYLQGNQATAASGFSSYGSGPVYVAAGATAFPNAGAGTWSNAFFLSPGPGYPTGLGSLKSQAATYPGTFTLLGPAGTTAGTGDRISGQSGGNTVTLKGQITGTGTLELTAEASTINWLLSNTNNSANNWTGGLLVDNTGNNNSEVKLAASEQIPNGSGAGNVTLIQSGSGIARLDLNSFNETINGLSSSGASALNQVGNFGIGVSTLTLGDNNATASFDGVIGGGNAINIVKVGSGTQTLANASTYTGSTTISNGVLALSGSGNLGNTTIFVTSNGKFDVSALGTFTMSAGATLSGSGVVTGSVATASGSTITPGGNSTLSFSNDLAFVSGSFSTFNLSPTTSGANDHVIVAGNLALNGGTVKIIGPTLQIGRYKLFTYGTESGSAANMSVFYSGLHVVNLDDSIPGEVDLVVQTATVPTLVWQGDNSLNNWDTTTFNWLNGATPTNYIDGNFVTFNDSGSKSPAVNLTTTLKPVSLVVSNNTGAYTFGGVGSISGATGLNKFGSGTLVLNESGQDNFSGGILVGGGSLVLSNVSMNISGGIAVTNGSLTDGDNGTIGGGLAVTSATASVIGNGTIGGNVVNTNGTIYLIGNGNISGNINNVSGSMTISNGPNIAGDIAMAGGTVLLDQTTTPSGNTIINGGTLQLGNNDANGNLAAGTITDNGSLVFNRTDTGLTMATVISGSGSLTQNGTGTVTLTAIEGYTGITTVNAGVLVVNHGNSQPSTLTSSSALIINTNGTVQVGVDNSLAGSGGTLGTLPVTINAGGLLTGLAGDDSGAGTSSHIRGLLTLNGGRFSNSGTSINTVHGSWNLDDNVAVNTGPNYATTSIMDCQSIIPDTAGGTFFTVNPGATPSGVDLLVTGTFINGSSTHDTGIIKNGTGTMVISNDVTDGQLNNYIGATIISNGTLRVDGSISASAVTVAGGMLSGIGTLGGAVTVNGIVAPGWPSAVGKLTCSSTVALNGTNVMRIDKTGNTNDFLSAGSSLTYGGMLVVSNLSAPLANGDTFTLFSATTYGGGFTSIVPATPGAGLAWYTNNLTVNGTLSVSNAAVTGPTTNANITKVSLSSTNVVIHGTNNNVPNTSFHYVVLTSPSLTNALSNWTPVVTNPFNPDGTFDYTNPIVPGTPRQFIDVEAVP
jgi:fibronectin-binding autotransporter adhesin